jgi:transposase
LAAAAAKREQKRGVVPGKGSAHVLSAKLRHALRLKQQGMSMRAAAAKVGVNRGTLAKHWDSDTPRDIALTPADIRGGRPAFLSAESLEILLAYIHALDAMGHPTVPSDVKSVIRFLKHQQHKPAGTDGMLNSEQIEEEMQKAADVKLSREVFNRVMKSINIHRPKTVRHFHAGARKKVALEENLNTFYDILDIVYKKYNITKDRDRSRMCATQHQ